jgi:uncharacterized protein (TIGR00297 family)
MAFWGVFCMAKHAKNRRGILKIMFPLPYRFPDGVAVLNPISVFVFAGLGAIAIAFLAYKLRALSISGAIAAAIVGFCHAGFARELGTVALLVFFGTSTLLSRLGKKRKANLHFEKGHQRDAGQVFANGGIAALCATLSYWYPALFLPALLGALAAANADTWATEIGSLLGGKPRRITNFQPTHPGESGAISLPGTLAALLGALLLGIVALSFGHPVKMLLAVTIGGFIGALADSLLGATLQVQYEDPETQKRIEQPLGPRIQGIPGFGNDVVNMLATLIGAIITLLLCHI